ncbi:MAG: hypothetical protein HC881_03235 [Leptolyngbyaceae cyanobacterium SL_7_1]|nr:hypothetical protein [Leptolyngbyaceae cyanobacterium SL_7_1]
MYLAEFALTGTAELSNELLIHASSETVAKNFAKAYAQHWGIDLFAFTPLSEQQVRQCRLWHQSVVLTSA